MQARSGPPSPRQLLMMLRIQWFSFVMTTLIIGGVSLYLASSRDGEGSALATPLAALAVLLGAGSLWGVRRVAQAAVPYYVLRWALAEAVAFLGMILAHLGAERGTFLPFAVGALALVVAAMPAEDEIASFPSAQPPVSD